MAGNLDAAAMTRGRLLKEWREISRQFREDPKSFGCPLSTDFLTE